MQRISYVPVETMDPAMQEEMRRCDARERPGPESSGAPRRQRRHDCFWKCLPANSRGIAIFSEQRERSVPRAIQ